MSDISLEFPIWVSLAFLGIEYWYVFVPVALALCGIGWFGRGLPMALRRAAWGAAGLCATPFALVLVLIAGDSVGRAQRAAEYRALHRTLAVAETVGTLLVPAGAVLEFTEETHHALGSVVLPRPSMVAGILLNGTLEPVTEREWAGDLAQDQVIGDWPCRAGRLWFTPAGDVTSCTLAAGHRLAGYDLPAGAECRHNPVTGSWEFRLPQDSPALRIAGLDADLPSGGTLVLKADGTLRRLYVPHESRLVIAGVALYDHVVLDGAALIGELAEPKLVAGVMLPAETKVRLDLPTGEVTATTSSPIVDP